MGKENKTIGYNIESLVREAQHGKSSAVDALLRTLQPKILRFNRRRLPSEAEDLTQEGLENIFQSLSTFRNIGKGNFEQNFYAWLFSITRSTLNSALRHVVKESSDVSYEEVENKPISEPEQTDAYSENMDSNQLMLKLQTEFRYILNKSERELVNFKLARKTNIKIAKELGITTNKVGAIITTARTKIDEALIYPAGFVRLSDYKEPALTSAGVSGALKVVRFLGRFYTKEEWVKQFNLRQRSVDQSLLKEGYIELSKVTTSSEYGTLRGKRYLQIIRRHGNRLYIRLADLENFRKRRVIKNKRIKLPGKDYQKLSDLVQTAAEYKLLLLAAQSGALVAKKSNGHWWYTTQKAVEQFYQKRSPYKDDRLRGTIYFPKKTREPVFLKFKSAQEHIDSKDEKGFYEWFFSVGKYASINKLPFTKRKLQMKLPIYKEAENKLSEDMLIWLTHQKILLTDYQRMIVNLRLKGIDINDIAKNLNKTLPSVKSACDKARDQIEKHLFIPQGIKRASEYNGAKIRRAAYKGRLEAVYFLGRWYTSDEKVNNYLQKAQKLGKKVS